MEKENGIPSSAMIRQLRGKSNLLMKLDLEFRRVVARFFQIVDIALQFEIFQFRRFFWLKYLPLKIRRLSPESGSFRSLFF